MNCKECLVSVVAIMLVIAFVDAVCGPEVTPWLAYAAPVALASRYCSFGLGAMYSVLAGLLLCVAARHSGHPFSSDAYFLLAVGWQTLALILVAWLVSLLATTQLALRKLLAERR